MDLKDKYLAWRNSEIVQHIAIAFITCFAGAALYIISPDLNPLDPIGTSIKILNNFKNFDFEYKFWNDCVGAALMGSVVPHAKLLISKYLNYTTPNKPDSTNTTK